MACPLSPIFAPRDDECDSINSELSLIENLEMKRKVRFSPVPKPISDLFSRLTEEQVVGAKLFFQELLAQNRAKYSGKPIKEALTMENLPAGDLVESFYELSEKNQVRAVLIVQFILKRDLDSLDRVKQILMEKRLEILTR